MPVDSGSTDHIAFDKSSMSNTVEYKAPEFVMVTNGKRKTMVGEGTTKIQLET